MRTLFSFSGWKKNEGGDDGDDGDGDPEPKRPRTEEEKDAEAAAMKESNAADDERRQKTFDTNGLAFSMRRQWGVSFHKPVRGSLPKEKDWENLLFTFCMAHAWRGGQLDDDVFSNPVPSMPGTYNVNKHQCKDGKRMEDDLYEWLLETIIEQADPPVVEGQERTKRGAEHHETAEHKALFCEIHLSLGGSKIDQTIRFLNDNLPNIFINTLHRVTCIGWLNKYKKDKAEAENAVRCFAAAST
jgi:hypothetical protein